LGGSAYPAKFNNTRDIAMFNFDSGRRCLLSKGPPLILFLTVMLLLAACDGSYSCTNYCYGVVQLFPANLNGVATYFNAVSLNGGDGHITDEIWLIEPFDGACANLEEMCWIEIGIEGESTNSACQLGVNATGVHVFWADNRPNQGYLCHDMGVLQDQEIGQPMFLAIAIVPGSPGTFDVELETCFPTWGTATCPGRAFSGISTNNTMMPQQWNIGLELQGTTGASAPQTQFFWNSVTDPSSFFGWGPLSIDGQPSVQSPVQAGWTTTPSTSTSGGSWFTSCCN
jgi:hypothetical protein